jgi:hypothetical protein
MQPSEIMAEDQDPTTVDMVMAAVVEAVMVVSLEEPPEARRETRSHVKFVEKWGTLL